MMRLPRTVLMSVALALGGCATAPLEQAGSLRSYDRMSDANGLVTRSKIRVNKKDVLAAKTIRIASTVFPLRPSSGDEACVVRSQSRLSAMTCRS